LEDPAEAVAGSGNISKKNFDELEIVDNIKHMYRLDPGSLLLLQGCSMGMKGVNFFPSS
jgi:hypothetical protein